MEKKKKKKKKRNGRFDDIDMLNWGISALKKVFMRKKKKKKRKLFYDFSGTKHLVNDLLTLSLLC